MWVVKLETRLPDCGEVFSLDNDKRARRALSMGCVAQVEVSTMLYRDELEEGGMAREDVDAAVAERRAELLAEAERDLDKAAAGKAERDCSARCCLPAMSFEFLALARGVCQLAIGMWGGVLGRKHARNVRKSL